MRALVTAALLFLVGCAPPSSSTSPTPTPSFSATPSTTPQPSGTRRPPLTVGPGPYVNAVLGYRIELPAGWRYSQCQSATDIGGLVAGQTETFTSASVEDESGTDVGPRQPVVNVRVVVNPAGRTALQWLSDGGMGFGDTFDRATVDGREGAHVIDASREVTALVTAARGRIYAITAHGPQGISSDVRRIMNSLHVLDDAELAAAQATFATPAPAAARSAEVVADTLARGFGQKDAAALGTVAWACISRGFQNSGAGFRSAARELDDLRKAFAAGLTVNVVARPVTTQAGGHGGIDATWTEAGHATRRANLSLLKSGDTWYWSGVVLGP